MNIHFLPVSYRRSTGVRAQSGAARAVLLSTRVGVLDQCRGHASFVLHLAPRATPFPPAPCGHLPFLLLFHPLPYLHTPWKIRPRRTNVSENEKLYNARVSSMDVDNTIIITEERVYQCIPCHKLTKIITMER